jgi:hypothetical protein
VETDLAETGRWLDCCDGCRRMRPVEQRFDDAELLLFDLIIDGESYELAKDEVEDDLDSVVLAVSKLPVDESNKWSLKVDGVFI